MKNRLIASLLVIVIVLATAGCITRRPIDPIDALGSVWPMPEGSNIATLGQEYVSAVLYGYFFTVNHLHLQQDAMVRGHVDLEYFWEIEQEGSTVRQILLDGSMRSAKEYTGLYRLGFALGITETPQEAAAVEEQIAARLDELSGDVNLFTQLYRLSPEQMREAARKLNIASSYFRQAMDDITFDEETARELYDADPDAFDLVTVRHVLIGINEEMTETQVEVSGDFARALLERVDYGEDIGSLAAQYSEDPGSRFTDGEYIFRRDGRFASEFEEWAFAATPGDTGIVQTVHGYHIMQLMDRTTFEELDDAIIEQQVRAIIFKENHQALYDLVDADGWVYDRRLLNMFISSI
ncbi:MAG: peptidylprolyl isomerase [Oscillospiraceae bacterium]|nr:peptidylprolyl isomerase [Oscillospiraceae bacterium]